MAESGTLSHAFHEVSKASAIDVALHLRGGSTFRRSPTYKNIYTPQFFIYHDY